MQQTISYILGIGGICGGVIAVYKMVSNPNIQQDKTIIKMDGEIKYNKIGIADIKKKTDKMDAKLDKIMTNHLPHLENAIVKLETTVKTLCKNVDKIIDKK